MARIYLSYRHTDKIIVGRIKQELIKRGHEISFDDEVLKVGQDWRKILFAAIKEADGVLVLISENSLQSNYVVSEVGTARAYVAESANKKFLIPVIHGDIAIPSFIEDLYCVRLNDDNFSEAINQIDSSISSFLGKQEAVRDNLTEERKNIETQAADYIKDATGALKRRELRNSVLAYVCYAVGLGILISGAIITTNGFKYIDGLLTKDNKDNWGIYIFLFVKSAIIIGLLIACSKYAFTLGKSFMHEALRNADRIHAISFGEFFLKAYGDKIASHDEVKEIFRDWNIDKPSSAFSRMNANTFDPKIQETLLEIIRSLSGNTRKSE